MAWMLAKFKGSDSTPQADNAELGEFELTGEDSIRFPYAITIQDIVLTKKATQNHKYQLFVGGRAQENFIPSGVLDPTTEGRVRWDDQGMTILAGTLLQIKGAQLDGSSAEATELFIKYIEVTG